jgi:hypothetical protein
MPVLFKAAATTAQLADRPELRHFRVELRVQSAKLGLGKGIKECGFYYSGLHVIRHSGDFEMDATISSTVYSRPRPEPGQIAQTWSQSSGVATFSGQKGQVWH